jgi:hypothetical protein
MNKNRVGIRRHYDRHVPGMSNFMTHGVLHLIRIARRAEIIFIHACRTGKNHAPPINQHFIDAFPVRIAIIAVANLDLAIDRGTIRFRLSHRRYERQGIGISIVPILNCLCKLIMTVRRNKRNEPCEKKDKSNKTGNVHGDLIFISFLKRTRLIKVGMPVIVQRIQYFERNAIIIIFPRIRFARILGIKRIYIGKIFGRWNPIRQVIAHD